jgi:hypothetical protein
MQTADPTLPRFGTDFMTLRSKYYTVSVASGEQFITKTVDTNRPPVAIAIGSVDGHPRLFVVTVAGQMATYGHQPTCSLRLSDFKLLRIC